MHCRLRSAAVDACDQTSDEVADSVGFLVYPFQDLALYLHGDDAMPVASAKDSIEAAKVLFAYDMGKPVESVEVNSVNVPKVLIYLPANGRDPVEEDPPAEAQAETPGSQGDG